MNSGLFLKVYLSEFWPMKFKKNMGSTFLPNSANS